jgi:hypothetical protein
MLIVSVSDDLALVYGIITLSNALESANLSVYNMLVVNK